MSAVVECPACHESLELPDEFIEGVVCPHCDAAFILKPVLLNEHGEPIEEQPASSPAPVAPPPESSQASGSPADTASTGGADKETSSASSGDAGNAVSSEGDAPSEASASSSGLRFAALAAAGDIGSKDSGDIAVAAAEAESAAAESESKADADKDAKADKKTDQPKKDDADSDSPWANLGSTDSGSSSKESAPSKDSMSAKAVRQRKNQGPSMLSLAIGVVISGFVGLYLGYWLLNFFGGPRFHFIDLPLPFIDHSASSDDGSGDFPAPPPGGGPITIESPRSKQQPRRNRRPQNNQQGQMTPAVELPTVATQPPAEPAPAQQGAMPSFSSQELADALTEANRTTSTPGGDVQVTSELYEQLCRLAHVATFVDVNEPQVLARREAVHTVLRRLTHRPQQIAAINALAQTRLAAAAVATDPIANPGIVLAGQVVGSTSSGPWQLTRVQLLHAAQAAPARPAPSATPLESQLPGSASAASPMVAQTAYQPQATLVQNPPVEAPAAVTLVSTGRIPLEPGASRLFVGSVIVQPRQALPGYMVDDSPVVWAGTWVSLASDAS